MKYIQKPCLEHIALVKIVATLWKQKDITDLIPNSSHSLYFQWQNLENRVIKKVPQLPVPGILKEKIKSFVKPIGLQIRKWMQFHCINNHFHMDLLGELCWTPQGTIDETKTAEILIKDGNLDIVKRFKLACIYCLKNDIVKLWNKIPESRRESPSDSYLGNSKHLTQFHWPHMMQVGYNHPSFSDRHMFKFSAVQGNKTATKYFLQKLTSAEREESLVETAMYVKDSELLVFLLSQMNEEQEKEVFKSDPSKVLICFLDWPLQNFFFEVVDSMWEFLSRIDFDRLLQKIIEKITDGYKDCSYEKLFEDFWQKSASDLKSYVIAERSCRYLLPYLTQIKDKDKMKLIFQDAAFAVKKECIDSYTMDILSSNFICVGEWDFLRFLIHEWLPSGTERIKFKEEFERNMGNNFFKYRFKTHKIRWDKFFSTFDSVSKYTKRELEEENERRPSKISHIVQ